MVYNYTLSGKLHNSDRHISYTASIPLGLSLDDLQQRVIAFSKAFDSVKLETK